MGFELKRLMEVSKVSSLWAQRGIDARRTHVW